MEKAQFIYRENRIKGRRPTFNWENTSCELGWMGRGGIGKNKELKNQESSSTAGRVDRVVWLNDTDER